MLITRVRVLCPNGLRAASKSHCPRYSLWRNSHTTLSYDSRTYQVSSVDGAAPCGSTVDAVCACGAGKVKAFDEDDNTFHCFSEPPTDACPVFGQQFNFDLSVWACELIPFDENPKDAMRRIMNCQGQRTFIRNYWTSVSHFAWNNDLVDNEGRPALGAVHFPDPGETGPITMEINRQLIHTRSTAERNRWYILNRVLHHEMVHVGDGVVHGYGLWEPKEEGKILREQMDMYGFPHTWNGYEDFTEARAVTLFDHNNADAPCFL